MLYLQTLLRAKVPVADGLKQRRLAVASCGNAALSAATIAAAAEWPIDVFIPDDARPAVKARLEELGANVTICPKEDNARLGGDATVFHFRKAVADGAIPFSVQSTDNGLAADGTSTLVWEAVEQLAAQGVKELGSVVVQVGGGALASGCISGLRYEAARGGIPRVPTFHTVQTTGCAPLNRCYSRMKTNFLNEVDGPVSKSQRQKALARAIGARGDYMFVWDDPHSVAHGILDDEVYDWVQLCDGMMETSGKPVVVDDDTIRQACKDARRAMGVEMCHTGASGFAGVQHLRSEGSAPQEPVLVIFSGIARDETD